MTETAERAVIEAVREEIDEYVYADGEGLVWVKNGMPETVAALAALSEAEERTANPPPGVPADAAPFIIPADTRFVAIVIGEDGKAQITVRGIEHDAAMRVMVRCSLVVWDDGQAADAQAAAEAADAP